MKRPRSKPVASIPDSEFAKAASEARSLRQLMLSLGISGGGGSVEPVKRRIQKLGLDISHFHLSSLNRMHAVKDAGEQTAPSGARLFYDYTDAEFANLVSHVSSLSMLARAMKRTSHSDGGFHHLARQRIEKLGLDISHFRFERGAVGTKLKREVIFQKNGNAASWSATKIRSRLLREGLLEDRCNRCKNPPIWMGEPLTLSLHYNNQDRTDLRLENLQLLCPNCYRQLNSGRYIAQAIKSTEIRKKNLEIEKYKKLLDE